MKHSSLDYVDHPPNPRFQDLTGRTYNRLTVLGYAGNRKWFCVCQCGEVTSVRGTKLKSGGVKSCGCLQSEAMARINGTHMQTHSPEYRAFHAAKNRCKNPKNSNYHRYGGRGIEFRFNSFEEFLDAIGPRPEDGLSLDRIDNDGHYEPGNVRWATKKKQRLNQGDGRYLTVYGQTKRLQEWATLMGINYATLYRRAFVKGYCHPCAVTLPLGASCPHQ